MGGFRFFRAQKLASRRQIEEELAHLNGCTGCAAGGLDLEYLSAADEHLRALQGIAVALTRGEGETADARNARQGFTAEAHSGDGREVFSPPDLARGMSLQAEQCVIAAHAESIIHNANQAASPCLDLHHYARGPRIQRALDQFFH